MGTSCTWHLWPCCWVLPGRRGWRVPLGARSRWGCWSSEVPLWPFMRWSGCRLWSKQFLNHWLPIAENLYWRKATLFTTQILFLTSLTSFYWPIQYWVSLEFTTEKYLPVLHARHIPEPQINIYWLLLNHKPSISQSPQSTSTEGTKITSTYLSQATELHKPSVNSPIFPTKKARSWGAGSMKSHTAMAGFTFASPGTSEGWGAGKWSHVDNLPPGWTKLPLEENTSWPNKSKQIPFCSILECFQRCLDMPACLIGRWKSNGFNFFL